MRLVVVQIGDHRHRSVFVLFALGQLQQVARIGQARQHIGNADHGLFQHRTLAAQGLRAFGVVPHIRTLELPADFL